MIFLLLTNDAIAITSANSVTIEQLQNQISEIQRDQLNYKIEKDLLKETYSTNYATIQLVITIILAVSTILGAILGYFGVNNINNLKKEYEVELTKIRELKADFETKLQELTTSQKKVEGELQIINTRNEEQDKKIKLLEIKEKIVSRIKEKNYPRAFQYVGIGLDMVNDDYELLTTRALLFIKLKDYPAAIESYKQVISMQTISDPVTILNYAEVYLLAGLIDNYDNLVAQYPAYFMGNNTVSTYLQAFKFYLQNNIAESKNLMRDFINRCDPSVLQLTVTYTGTWDYEDLYDFLNRILSITPEKILLIQFTNYLRGAITGEQMNQVIDNTQ